MKPISFDLMNNKPILDINTLNYLWDYFWRKRYLLRKTKRDCMFFEEYTRIMDFIEYLVREEE